MECPRKIRKQLRKSLGSRTSRRSGTKARTWRDGQWTIQPRASVRLQAAIKAWQTENDR